MFGPFEQFSIFIYSFRFKTGMTSFILLFFWLHLVVF